MSSTTARAGSLPRYLLTRLALVIPMIWILITIVFFLMRGIGDPIEAMLGDRLPADQIAARRHAAGFDRPIIVQYGDYLWQLLHGNLGTTLTDNRPVTDVLRVNGAATLELAFWAFLIALGIGIPLGRIAARHRDRIPDVFLRISGVLFYAAPVFFVGLLGKLVFSVWLNWLPVSGRIDVTLAYTPTSRFFLVDSLLAGNPAVFADVLRHLVLPAVTLGIASMAIIARMTRSSMLEVIRQDFIATARAKGLAERVVVLRHALKNALSCVERS